MGRESGVLLIYVHTFTHIINAFENIQVKTCLCTMKNLIVCSVAQKKGLFAVFFLMFVFTFRHLADKVQIPLRATSV